jgi:hypothetical protein
MSLSIAALFGVAHPALAELKAGELAARAALVKARDALPDMADYFNARIAEADAKIAALDSAVSPEGLVATGTSVLHELAGLKHGLSPKPHAGDVTGG